MWCPSIHPLVTKLDNLIYNRNDYRYDNLAFSESWLSTNISSDKFKIHGFQFIGKDRDNGIGGGLVLYIRETFKYEIIDVSSYIEQLFIKITSDDFCFVVGVFYKPPHINYKFLIDSLETSLS